MFYYSKFAAARRLIRLGLASIACGAMFCLSSAAQSEDAQFPTPAREAEIAGRIAARDIGDARVTRHFYAFNGGTGELTLTVESENLNGDVDVFTANGLRPLLKLTLYPGGVKRITKNIYLTKETTLILRVEGRSENDNPGEYRFSFGGTFIAYAGDAPTAPDIPAEKTLSAKGRRTTSAGALIPLPPAPEPTPAPVSETAVAEVEPETVAPPAPNRAIKRKSSPRAGRNVRTPPATNAETTAANPDEANANMPATSETAGNTNATEPPPVAPTRAAARTPARRRNPRADRNPPPATVAGDATASPTATAGADAAEVAPANPENAPALPKPAKVKTAKAVKAKPAPPPVVNAMLIIETKDGGRIEREMKTVRRVTVERGQVVVVMLDGTVEKVSLFDVTRMTVEPLPQEETPPAPQP